ncbi:MAG: biotin--[acetyl-CoA-carboxylase] ligase [Myxococcales bacterium]|jgi:BirA family biotin operon repressor/biotin-[acetyl-CoA-carboxylase] ligase|nr:biotin--[acetyl-CoA-carboxylase] ligase [Myxococcales bacterium]
MYKDLERVPALVAERGLALGAPLTCRDETASTNDDAKRAAKEGAPAGSLFLAESQTAGRGRMGRTWLSARGENLLFSLVVRPNCPPSRVPPLALVAGLAVRDAVAKVVGEGEVKVKWPNDVLVRGKKIAGVLVESTVVGSRVDAVIVGIGVNVLSRDLPEAIASIATSVALELPAGAPPPDRAAILVDVLAGLDRDLGHVAARGLGLVHARLGRADALRGRRVAGELGAGTAEGVDTDGRLLVRDDAGVLHRWSSGEVTLAPRRA